MAIAIVHGFTLNHKRPTHGLMENLSLSIVISNIRVKRQEESTSSESDTSSDEFRRRRKKRDNSNEAYSMGVSEEAASN